RPREVLAPVGVARWPGVPGVIVAQHRDPIHMARAPVLGPPVEPDATVPQTDQAKHAVPVGLRVAALVLDLPARRGRVGVPEEVPEPADAAGGAALDDPILEDVTLPLLADQLQLRRVLGLRPLAHLVAPSR